MSTGAPHERERKLDVRRAARPPFTMVENAIFADRAVGANELAVYVVLCFHADRDNRTCYPSYRLVAEEAGVSRSTAIRAIGRLIQLDYIKRTCRKRDGTNESQANLYEITAQHRYEQLGGVTEAPPGISETLPVVPHGNQVVSDVHREQESENQTQLNQSADRVIDMPPMGGHAEASLSPLKDTLANLYQERMTEVFPHEGWANYRQERGQLATLAKKTRALRPKTPFEQDVDLANAVLSQFMAMIRRGKGGRWREVPFTPSALSTRWSDVIAALAEEYDRQLVWDEETSVVDTFRIPPSTAPAPTACPTCGGKVRSVATRSAVVDFATCTECKATWELVDGHWIETESEEVVQCRSR